LDQVIPSRSGHQLISAQRSRRVVMGLGRISMRQGGVEWSEPGEHQ
jgi:hypothetical protein